MRDRQGLGPPGADDYEAIEAAVMETGRGRWFLAEYARRNRHAETSAILGTLRRVESAVAMARAAEPGDWLRSEIAALSHDFAQADRALPDGAEAHGAARSETFVHDVDATVATLVDVVEALRTTAASLAAQGVDRALRESLERRLQALVAVTGMLSGASRRLVDWSGQVGAVQARLDDLAALAAAVPPRLEAPTPDAPSPGARVAGGTTMSGPVEATQVEAVEATPVRDAPIMGEAVEAEPVQAPPTEVDAIQVAPQDLTGDVEPVELPADDRFVEMEFVQAAAPDGSADVEPVQAVAHEAPDGSAAMPAVPVEEAAARPGPDVRAEPAFVWPLQAAVLKAAEPTPASTTMDPAPSAAPQPGFEPTPPRPVQPAVPAPEPRPFEQSPFSAAPAIAAREIAEHRASEHQDERPPSVLLTLPLAIEAETDERGTDERGTDLLDDDDIFADSPWPARQPPALPGPTPRLSLAAPASQAAWLAQALPASGAAPVSAAFDHAPASPEPVYGASEPPFAVAFEQSHEADSSPFELSPAEPHPIHPPAYAHEAAPFEPAPTPFYAVDPPAYADEAAPLEQTPPQAYPTDPYAFTEEAAPSEPALPRSHPVDQPAYADDAEPFESAPPPSDALEGHAYADEAASFEFAPPDPLGADPFGTDPLGADPLGADLPPDDAAPPPWTDPSPPALDAAAPEHAAAPLDAVELDALVVVAEVQPAPAPAPAGDGTFGVEADSPVSAVMAAFAAAPDDPAPVAYASSDEAIHRAAIPTALAGSPSAAIEVPARFDEPLRANLSPDEAPRKAMVLREGEAPPRTPPPERRAAADEAEDGLNEVPVGAVLARLEDVLRLPARERMALFT